MSSSSSGAARLRQFAGVALLLGVFGLALVLAGGARLERADFTFNNGTEIQSLDPATVTGVPEGRVIRSVYEGLVGKHPATLAPTPGIAESWEMSPDGKTWTFHIRPDTRWSNGDVITAPDLEWSFKRFMEPETAAEYAYMLWCVENGREFTIGESQSGEKVGFADWKDVGLKATDEWTLVFELHSPLPYFLELIAFYPLYPVHRKSLETAKERWPDTWAVEWLKPENIVTNGPFIVESRRINDRIRLRKNPYYWDADNVAFETIDVLAVESYVTATNLYLTGEVEWLDATVPANLVPDMLKREDLIPKPYIGSYFYRVNTTKPPLDDPRVRRALALSINRDDVTQKITKAGQEPSLSVVPWQKEGDGGIKSPLDIPDPIAEAKRLLDEAGYGPTGKDFPTLEIHYNTSETHKDIAEVIGAAWNRDLGISARLSNQEWKVYLDTQTNLEYDVSRSAWIGDYANPAALNFLELFVTGGENNKTGWGNPEFDELIEVAKYTTDEAARSQAMLDAERILLDEMPVLPIYSYVTQNIVSPRLGGFHSNLLNEHFPKYWYWMDDEELAERRAKLPEGKRLVDPGGPPAGLYSPAGKAKQIGRDPR